MKKTDARRLARAAVMAAICCVATMAIQIPSPLSGYLNLGDCTVLLSGWLLGPWYGLAAGGLGSALADVCSGYAVYAPGTLVIKGAMAAVSGTLYALLRRRAGHLASCLASGLAGECIMAAGYLAYDGLCLGFGLAALAGLPGNLVQGAAGLAAATALSAALGDAPGTDRGEEG